MKEEFGSFATGFPPDFDGLSHIEIERKKLEEHSESVEIVNQMAEKIGTLKDRCRKLHEKSRKLSEKITEKRAEYKEENGILEILKNNLSDSLFAGVETFQRISSCKAKISVIKTEFNELKQEKNSVGVELKTAEREAAIMEEEITMDRKVMLAMNAVYWKYGSPISVNMLKQNPAFENIFNPQKEQPSITGMSDSLLSSTESSNSDNKNVNKEEGTAVKAMIEIPHKPDIASLAEKNLRLTQSSVNFSSNDGNYLSGPLEPVTLSSEPIQMEKEHESDQPRHIQLPAADQQIRLENLLGNNVVENIVFIPIQTFAEEKNQDQEEVQTKQNKSANVISHDPKNFSQQVISLSEESRALIAPTERKSFNSQSSFLPHLTTVIVKNPSYSNPTTSSRKQSRDEADNSFAFSLAENAQVARLEQINNEEVIKPSKKPAEVITILSTTKESYLSKPTDSIENTREKIINSLVKPSTGTWQNNKPPLPLFINFLSCYDQMSILSRWAAVTNQETTTKVGIKVSELSMSRASVSSAVFPSAVKNVVPIKPATPIENTIKRRRGRPRKNSVVHATTKKQRFEDLQQRYFKNGVDVNEIKLEDGETYQPLLSAIPAQVTNEAELLTNSRREYLSRKAKTLPISYVDLTEIYDDDFPLSPTSYDKPAPAEAEILRLSCCEKSGSIIKNETTRKRGRPRQMLIGTTVAEKLPDFEIVSTNQDNHVSIEPPTSKLPRNDSLVLSDTNSSTGIVCICL